MALFMDGPVSGIENLMAQDTQLSSVATAEGIDVTQKLALAQEELAFEIAALFEGSRGAAPGFGLTAPPNLGNVVVTAPLRLWHTLRTLALVYGDAYASQLSDRYTARRNEFRERANRAYEQLLVLGIGMARSPMPRAGQPQVASAPGNLADGTYFVSMTWVNERGQEGAPSTAAAVTTAANSFSVQPAAPPKGATGWNVYAGVDPGGLSRQNGTLIGVSETWLQPNSLGTDGIGPGCGQSPDYLMPMPRIILRG